MEFTLIMSNLTASGPVGCFIACGIIMAVMYFAEMVGNVLARFYAGRIVRGKL